MLADWTLVIAADGSVNVPGVDCGKIRVVQHKGDIMVLHEAGTTYF